MDEIDPDDIQARMAKLRRGTSFQIRAAVSDAKDWFDWRKLIVRHPIASIGVAAALGFALFPRRSGKKMGDQAGGNGHVSLAQVMPSAPVKNKSSLGYMLFRAIASTVITVAVNRAIQSLSHRAVNVLAPPHNEPLQPSKTKRAGWE